MSSSSVGARRWRRHLVPGAIMGVLTLAAVLFVLASLRRPSIDTWPPTPPDPREVGTMRVGPRTYTVDAMASGQWVFFDFSRGSIVTRPGPLDWDLAFQRFRIIANGGRGFAGRGAIADLGSVALELPVVVPADAWVETEARSDSTNSAIARWYTYGFTSHLLEPKPHVWAIRTADGRHAVLRILSYYCPGATPGCLTFEYVYEGGKE
jgi:hypothetical protein